jgi:hypothetical protein
MNCPVSCATLRFDRGKSKVGTAIYALFSCNAQILGVRAAFAGQIVMAHALF